MVAVETLVPGLLVHRQAFPGEGAFIDGGIPFHHHPVHRDVFPGTDGEDIPFLHIIDGNGDFLPVPDQHGGFGSQFHEPFQGISGPALAHGFQHLPQGDQGRDHGCRFKIQVVHIQLMEFGERRPMNGKIGDFIEHRQAPQEGNGRPQGHQGIHVGSPVEQSLESAGVEIPVDGHDDQGQEQLGEHQPQMVPVQQGRHRPVQHIVAPW